MSKKDILYPLRRLHGMLHEWYATNQYEKSWWGKNADVRVLMPGLPDHTNLGDSAIVIAQRNFLRSAGISTDHIREVSFSEYPVLRKALRRAVRKQDLIVHLGGGNMGSQWKREEDFHRLLVTDFPRNPMIIFPQTIFYAGDADAELQKSIPVYNAHPRLTITGREKVSWESIRQLYPKANCILTPDIVLSANMATFGAKPQERNGILLCMRKDPERSVTDKQQSQLSAYLATLDKNLRYTDMHSSCGITKDNREKCVKEKMEEIAGAELVVTDRLHGMIFAAITGTPCVAFGNYNHKVRGTYEWIRYLPYIRFVETVAEAEQVIPELLTMKNCSFDNGPLQPYFETLAQVVREYADDQRHCTRL